MVAGALLDASYRSARPLLFRMDPEEAHLVVLNALRAGGRFPGLLRTVRRLVGVDDVGLAVEAFGLRFPNAVGLAAGLDKNGIALPAWAALGFGHVEVGTVTPQAQAGNPRPRIFRLPAQRALINRMGFPNDGAAALTRRLATARVGLPLVVGGNVGKGRETPIERAVDDYEQATRTILPQVDYLAVNVSSPNTPELRRLQAPEHAAEILRRLRGLTAKPILLKLAPDLELDALPDIVAAAREAGASGFVATNTTTDRAGLPADEPVARETGGLSGRPLRARSLAFTARLAELAGRDLPVVSAGGIASPEDVRERLATGARLVQVYTALVYEGPGLVARLARAAGGGAGA